MEIITTRPLEYDPLNNFMFYKVMGEKGNEIQLLGFLNAVLGKTGEERFTFVEILENKSFSPQNIGGKSGTLDVRAVLSNKTRVNVEAQIRNQHNIDKRSLYYWSKEYSESLLSGQDYVELPDVIAINIVNFDFPATRNFHSCFHLQEDTEKDIILTNALEIHYLNMVKYRKQGRNMHRGFKAIDPLCRWLAWLDKSSPPELLAEVMKMDTAIQSANERMVHVTGDKEAIRAYWRHQMDLSDRTSELNYARDEGRDEVIELFEQGLSVDEVKQRLKQKRKDK